MKPTYEITGEILNNEDKFEDRFFKRFKLRHAPRPLELNENVSKNYLFPTFYGDVTCAIGIFMCSFKQAKKMMPHPKIKPVRMTLDRSLVIFSCYIYKNVMNVAPYNEIAMTIPVMVDPVINMPVLPMITDIFKEFGYYVFSMPVTSLENQIRGRKIWGLPKVVQRIDIEDEGGDCAIRAFEEDSEEQYFELKVPKEGDPEDFDVCSWLYSRLGNELLQSQTCFKSTFNVNKNMEILLKKNATPDRQYLKIGDSPSGRMLQQLGIEEHPFQFRYAEGMTSCFDLPNDKFKSPVKF